MLRHVGVIRPLESKPKLRPQTIRSMVARWAEIHLPMTIIAPNAYRRQLSLKPWPKDSSR